MQWFKVLYFNFIKHLAKEIASQLHAKQKFEEWKISNAALASRERAKAAFNNETEDPIIRMYKENK